MLYNDQLREFKDQLLDGNRVIRQLQDELDNVQHQLKQAELEGQRNKERLANEMHEFEMTKQKLMQKLEAANNELSTMSNKVSSLQKFSKSAHELEGEVLQLRTSLADQQKLRMEHQRGREMAEKDSEKYKGEKNELKKRLEQSSHQLLEMQKRSEEWRKERERWTSKNKEVSILLKRNCGSHLDDVLKLQLFVSVAPKFTKQ